MVTRSSVNMVDGRTRARNPASVLSRSLWVTTITAPWSSRILKWRPP